MYKAPDFPKHIEYKQISLDEYSQLYPLGKIHADFCFGNLGTWLDLNHDLKISTLNNNLVLSYSSIFENNDPTISLIGLNQIDKSLDEIFSYQKKHGLKQKISFVPEETIEKIENKQNYQISDNRDNWDYILDSYSLSRMTGNNFRSFRRKVIRFIKEYGQDVVIREIDLSDMQQNQTIINAMHTWKSVYTLSENDKMRVEGKAINAALLLAPKIKNLCIGIYINGNLESFCIFQIHEQNNKKLVAIANHIKCNYDFEHIFDFTTFCLSSYLYQKKIISINFEQDLGIDGLRQHKLMLRPTGFLKKFTITPKDL
jgi:hypothetical protein